MSTFDRIGEVALTLEEVTRETQAAFGSLSTDQLNWKPAERAWSVAQCLDHLVTINSLYFPVFDAMSTGPVRPTFWERHSPFSGWLGRLLIRTLSPEYPKKTKTTAKAEPSASLIDGVIDRFAQHQAELIGRLRKIPDSIDPAGTIITSPLLRLITYSLDDCFTIMTVHEKRHVEQAKRVMGAEGFPQTR
jgi:hypothetical protein